MFSEKKYEVLKKILKDDLLEFVKINFDIYETCMLAYDPPTSENLYPFRDSMMNNTFSVYASLFSESLLKYFKSTISNVTSKSLHETYSYARTYYYGSDLKPHIDRPSCEYSITMCIEKTDDWPIYFYDQSTDTEYQLELDEGDAVVYSGTILKHWRNIYLGKKHRQIFLHYVDANGEYSSNIYDGRPHLGHIGNYKI